MRIVLDTDVLIAAFRSDQGASRQLLLAALNGDITLLLSVPVMLEYEAVLTRPEQIAEIGLSRSEIGAVLDAMAAVAHPVSLWFLWRPSLKDVKDEMVLETAVNGAADVLGTFNLRHLARAAAEFGIKAMRPGDLWWHLKGQICETE